jgi:hypothetical protein
MSVFVENNEAESTCIDLSSDPKCSSRFSIFGKDVQAEIRRSRIFVASPAMAISGLRLLYIGRPKRYIQGHLGSSIKHCSSAVYCEHCVQLKVKCAFTIHRYEHLKFGDSVIVFPIDEAIQRVHETRKMKIITPAFNDMQSQ